MQINTWKLDRRFRETKCNSDYLFFIYLFYFLYVIQMLEFKITTTTCYKFKLRFLMVLFNINL